jgi:hypothetical protein
VVLVAVAVFAQGVAAAAESPSQLPPSPHVVGPPSASSASPVVAQVIKAWTTMKSTLYTHKYSQNDGKTGIYNFDCVGATNYFLGLGAPNANNAMRKALNIRRGFAPKPAQEASYLAGLPAAGNGLWKPARSIAQIKAGDLIAVPPVSTLEPGVDPKEPGHSMMVAGPPVALSDGSYALLVWDSTGVPAHGPSDTRNWDPLNQPLAGTTRASGLGQGTIQITATASGAPDRMHWSVGGAFYGGQLQIAQPLS